jgi:multidrug efflux pump subunit AcrA (membrane-fusion protein)
LLLRCTVDNTERLLKPGMFVSARVPRPGITALTVPEQAVQTMGEGTAVFVAQGEGKFERRNVVLGERAEGRVTIASGLVAGEMVVVEGAFWVRTELQKSELEE